jgi:hypothetical protein
MPALPPRPLCQQWRDAEGTPILLRCRIEQIAVSQQHGAMPSRLHQHGQVIARDTHWLHVRFDDDQHLVLLQPHLVRVLDQAPDGD